LAEPDLLEIANVTAGYSAEVDILHDIELRVPEGKIVAVVGPNGSGKSTLLRVATGNLTPKSGRIDYSGQSLIGVAAHEIAGMGIGYLPQERTIFPNLSVEETLKLGAWTFRRDRARTAEGLERVYKQFPLLAERRRTQANELSGGMQKLLEVGRALIAAPKLLVFDEPTVGLAPKVAREIYDTLSALAAGGQTILLVDQNVREAVRIADWIYVLELGRNSADGSAESFMEDLTSVIQKWLKVGGEHVAATTKSSRSPPIDAASDPAP